MKKLVGVIVIVVLLIGGCTPTQTASRTPSAVTESTVDAADSDGAITEGIVPEEITEEASTMSVDAISSELKQAVLQAVGAQRNLPPEQLEIVSVAEAEWPDACLGLAGPDEMCAMMLTSGWAFGVSDGQQTWQYRTDMEARQVRLDEGA